MNNSNQCWPVSGLLVFLLVFCLAEPSQGFSIHGLQEGILNSQEAGNTTLNEGRVKEPDEDLTRVSLQGYANRRRRNVIDDAKQTVKATTEKLSWVKKNSRYLLLMVGSIFFLFFSCAMYRRLTMDRDEEEDDIKVVVIGGPKEQPQSTKGSNPPVSTTESKRITNSRKTKKSSKPKTNVTKEDENVKSTRMKEKRERTEPEQGINESDSNTWNDNSDDSNSSSSEYDLEVPVYQYSDDLISSDLNNACADGKREHEIKLNRSLFNALLNPKKKPFAQIKRDACVINEGIPLSSYTSLQQTHQSESELKMCKPTTQYVDEIREHAELLYGKRQVTHSTTSYSQYPDLDEVQLSKRFVASIMEKCGHYYPMASTNTMLPVTATAE